MTQLGQPPGLIYTVQGDRGNSYSSRRTLPRLLGVNVYKIKKTFNVLLDSSTLEGSICNQLPLRINIHRDFRVNII